MADEPIRTYKQGSSQSFASSRLPGGLLSYYDPWALFRPFSIKASGGIRQPAAAELGL